MSTDRSIDNQSGSVCCVQIRGGKVYEGARRGEAAMPPPPQSGGQGSRQVFVRLPHCMMHPTYREDTPCHLARGVFFGSARRPMPAMHPCCPVLCGAVPCCPAVCMSVHAHADMMSVRMSMHFNDHHVQVNTSRPSRQAARKVGNEEGRWRSLQIFSKSDRFPRVLSIFEPQKFACGARGRLVQAAGRRGT